MDASAAATLRLFLGLWPAADLLVQLQEQAADWHWPASARRTRPERLHVTLHFIGDVPAARLPELQDRLAVAWEGCELDLDRPRLWPGGLAVLEASEVPPELTQLHVRLAERLRALGLPVEDRRYRPHVTLARKAFGARPPLAMRPVRWRAGPAYRLVRTLPGGRGYEPVQLFG